MQRAVPAGEHVARRGDGQLLLVRSLPNTWNGSVDRLAVDLNRTILFLTQQYGVGLNDVMWLFGPGAREQAPALEDKMQLPVAVHPEEFRPFHWATEALKLRPGRTPNFLSRVLQHAPRRRAYAKVVGASAGLLVLAAAATAAFAVWQARQETSNLERLRQNEARLLVRRQSLQQRNARLVEDQQMAKLVLAGRPDPVPVWFLAYLSEAMPPDLAATYLHLISETNGWALQMATTWEAARPAPGAMPPDIPTALARLQTQLSNGPFHLQPVSAARPDPSARPSAGPQGAGEPLLVEGVIR